MPVAVDSIYEPDETFAVEFFIPTSGIKLGDTRVFGTILNDDAPPKPVVSIEVDHPGQFEGKPGESTAYTFMVKLGAAAATPQSVHWAVSGGSLSPTAATDFNGATSGTVAFASGETEKSVTVGVAGDAAAEPDETFVVSLSAGSSRVDVRPQTYALATVLSDDRTAPPLPLHVSDAQIAAYTAMAERMFQHLVATHGDHFWLH